MSMFLLVFLSPFKKKKKKSIHLYCRKTGNVKPKHFTSRARKTTRD